MKKLAVAISVKWFKWVLLGVVVVVLYPLLVLGDPAGPNKSRNVDITEVGGSIVSQTAGVIDVALAAGTANIGDVDVKIMGTAATIDDSFTGQTADFIVEAATANLRLLGWSAREDAGAAAAATVVLRHDADGTCDSLAVVAFIELSANQSNQMAPTDRGLAIPDGLCADVLAGSVSFVAHLVTEAAP